MPTVTETATPGPTVTATATPGNGLAIAEIAPEEEYVVLANNGNRSIDLEGYVVDFGGFGQRSAFGSYVLEPGDRVTVYTGDDGVRGPGIYMGFPVSVLDNDDDTVTVENTDGRIVAGRSYL